MRQLLIIGGSDAGIRAGIRAREVDPSCNVRLVVTDRYIDLEMADAFRHRGLEVTLMGSTLLPQVTRSLRGTV